MSWDWDCGWEWGMEIGGDQNGKWIGYRVYGWSSLGYMTGRWETLYAAMSYSPQERIHLQTRVRLRGQEDTLSCRIISYRHSILEANSSYSVFPCRVPHAYFPTTPSKEAQQVECEACGRITSEPTQIITRLVRPAKDSEKYNVQPASSDLHILNIIP